MMHFNYMINLSGEKKNRFTSFILAYVLIQGDRNKKSFSKILKVEIYQDKKKQIFSQFSLFLSSPLHSKSSVIL